MTITTAITTPIKTALSTAITTPIKTALSTAITTPIKTALFSAAAAGLIVGLSGCGSSDTPAVTAATSAPSAASPSASSTEPAAPASSAAGPATSPAPAAAKPALITIKDFKYTVPASVAPGSKITVKNADGENHTVTSAKGPFDVKAEAGGGTATFTAPTKPGSYPFVCIFHANMKGTLVVK